MKDHKYTFRVVCEKCNTPKIEKILLSLFIEPEIVWKTFLLLTGRTKYVCKDCTKNFIRGCGKYI